MNNKIIKLLAEVNAKAFINIINEYNDAQEEIVLARGITTKKGRNACLLLMPTNIGEIVLRKLFGDSQKKEQLKSDNN